MDDSITHILGIDGPIAERLEGYEPRGEQVEMACAVDRAMESGAHLFVEAGTGVGKSFAYLVPAIVRAMRSGKKVVVATNTIALQEQLVKKDIPILLDALAEGKRLSEEEGERDGLEAHPTRGREDDGLEAHPTEEGEGKRECKAVLVKGRGNYMSIRRLRLASERRNKLFVDGASRRSLDVIEEWAYGTEDGTLSSLPSVERMAVWNSVQSDSTNCMGRKCPHHGDCFYQAARKEMEDADLLICNHALFFSDMALRMQGDGGGSGGKGFLPSYDHVVLDEAHAVEDAAADHFGVSLTEGRVGFLLRQLYQESTQRGYLAQLALVTGDIEPVDKAILLVREAQRASDAFFDSLNRKLVSGGLVNGRVRSAGVVENVLSPAMNDVCLRLKRLKDDVTNDADRFELNAFAVRAKEISDQAETLIEQTAEKCVYWIETSGQPGRGGVRVTIACSPTEVAPLLKEHLFGGEASVVLTSATLTTREVGEDETPEHAETAFAHCLSRLGGEGASVLQLGSPFDYGSQVEVFVDASVPTPRRGAVSASGESFEEAIASRVHDHVVATDGGAFVLFTSFRLLYQTADVLRRPLEAMGYRVWVQGKDGPRTQMLDEFREHDRGVLFGASSFWQGVDVRGDRLRNVIITRLPFEPPDRPIVEARNELIRERGGDPFRDDSLPRAVIRFKQGFGRLIRSSTDSGRVVVLDPRIVTTGYGKAFRNAIPQGVELIRVGAKV
ncbi:MAG: hypothetical protein JKY43_01610 [Phycisphaerales bacterium]|nr:hypothetical protein [Phycisphaerales bacterium]